jgi:ABC-type bacteriocin/lantibiotic exporter with double-glycine peptidase domain
MKLKLEHIKLNRFTRNIFKIGQIILFFQKSISVFLVVGAPNFSEALYQKHR